MCNIVYATERLVRIVWCIVGWSWPWYTSIAPKLVYCCKIWGDYTSARIFTWQLHLGYIPCITVTQFDRRRWAQLQSLSSILTCRHHNWTLPWYFVWLWAQWHHLQAYRYVHSSHITLRKHVHGEKVHLKQEPDLGTLICMKLLPAYWVAYAPMLWPSECCTKKYALAASL